MISGIVKQTNSKQALPVVHHVMQEYNLRKFWETEEVPAPKENFWTYDEIAATKHYDTTTKRDNEGRFVVEMPFVQRNSDLGDSYLPTCSQTI